MIPPQLDPELAHLADLEFDFGSGSIDFVEIRSGLAAFVAAPLLLDGVTFERREVRQTPHLSVDTFTPATDGLHPCLIWLHGGGYMFGSAAMDAARLQQWAARFDCITVSIDYRLAPENPFPAAHVDAVNVLEWILEGAANLGVDSSRIVVGGASAGGGLAAGLVLAARDRRLSLAGQLLFYPMLDDRQETSSSQWNAPVWPRAANEFGWRAYLGALYGHDVPSYAAPSRVDSVEGLPPTLLIVGGADGFFDEDLQYAVRLTRAGVPTDIRTYAGAPHGFDVLAPDATSSRAALRDAEEWLQSVIADPRET
jgi:acetyl esterase/lipase